MPDTPQLEQDRSEAPTATFNRILHEGHPRMGQGWFGTDLAEIPVEDQAEIDRGAAANTALWVKPLWATLGLGGLGLLLFVGQFFLPQLFANPLPGWLGIARFAALLVGGVLLVVAAPAPITRDRVPQHPDAPPLATGHRPLNTRR
jgi:hypothetical protein